jgi:hypothetical protein
MVEKEGSLEPTLEGLEEHYPISVVLALRRWWTKHPGLWPYQAPEDLRYWLECLHYGKSRLRGELFLREVEWYLKRLADSSSLQRILDQLRKDLGWPREDDL